MLRNISESRAARQASRFGQEGPSFEPAKISQSTARRILENRGLTGADAADYVRSGVGEFSVRRAKPTEGFNRYSSAAEGKGRFLTPDSFVNPRQARQGLNLRAGYNNTAEFQQRVIPAPGRSPVLIESGVRGGRPDVLQGIVEPANFIYGRGAPVGR